MGHGPLLWTAMLRASGLLVPRTARADWYAEWQAELWQVRHACPARAVTRFCGGAFPDALALGLHSFRSHWSSRLEAGKPLRVVCALLALLLATSLLTAVLPGAAARVWHQPWQPTGAITLLSRNNSLGAEQPTIPFEDFRAWASDPDPRLRGLTFYRPATAWVGSEGAHPRHLRVGYASPAMVEILRPCLASSSIGGDGSAGLALLSRRVWREELNSDPHAVGRTLLVGSQRVTIAGIAGGDSWPLPGMMDVVVTVPERDLARRFAHSEGFVLAPAIRPALRTSDPSRPYLLVYSAAGEPERVEALSLQQRRHQPGNIFLFALLLACLALPTLTPLSLGDEPQSLGARSARGYLRRWGFLTLKLALVLPSTFLLPLLACDCLTADGTAAAVYLQLALSFPASLLALRWAFHDGQRRCPACLRRLSHPALVGHCSHSLLAWSGTELLCTSGHGFLHVPEHPTSWFRTARWLPVDSTWSELFSGV